MRRLLALLLVCSAPVLAAPPPGLTLSITGQVAHPKTYPAAELGKLAPTAADLPARDGAPAIHVTGVLLWPLLDQAGWIDRPGRKTHLQHVILARGRDGYTVALSIAELDPALEGKQVIAALQRNGKPTNTLELIVPNDKKPARRVHDLIAIEVQ